MGPCSRFSQHDGLAPPASRTAGPHHFARHRIASLQKLEADREALDSKQRELEVQAARELGEIILGSGLESFSKKGLRKVAEELGKLGEDAAIEKLTGRGATRASNTAPGTQ